MAWAGIMSNGVAAGTPGRCAASGSIMDAGLDGMISGAPGDSASHSGASEDVIMTSEGEVGSLMPDAYGSDGGPNGSGMSMEGGVGAGPMVGG